MKKNNYLALLHKIGFSHKKLHEIFDELHNYKEIYEKLDYKILKSYGFTEKQITFILDQNKAVKPTEIAKTVENHKVKIFSWHDSSYPEVLRNIINPPFLIYVQGEIDNSPKFSIVGSRTISNYGKKCIEHIVPDLGKYFQIISGGALGCDSEAHMVSLLHNIKTIVVVGTGIDECYPSGNKNMYSKIVKSGGAIISIFPFGEPANRYNFPVRNELVAGLGVGTLVVEAKLKSGSLITAKLALDLGKDVFACPGEIFRLNNSGCNELILKGEAKIVTKTEDILNEYNISVASDGKKINPEKVIFGDKQEQAIYELLLLEAFSVDELIEKTGMIVQELTLKLSMLEIGGYIKKSIIGKYELK